MITQRGLAATRIADIAERVGTSGPSLLYWFESKDELLAEALRYAEESFYDEVTALLEDFESPAERLRVLIESAIADYDWSLWLELWTRALRDERTAAARLHLDRRWRGEIEREVREGQRCGQFAPDCEPQRDAAIIACFLDGVAVQATLRDPDFSPTRIRALVLEITERILGVELPELPELDLSRIRGSRDAAAASKGER